MESKGYVLGLTTIKIKTDWRRFVLGRKAEKMKNLMKKIVLAALCLVLGVAMITGCAGAVAEEETTEKEVVLKKETQEEAVQETQEKETQSEEVNVEKTTVRVGGLKGPTSMGLLFLKQEAQAEEALENYEFTMVTAADELLTMMIKEELDIALVPANVASVLYNKTEGEVAVIDINTLGVLYMISGDTSINSVEDLKGKTIYLTGKGTTPDYVLHYILSANGLQESDYTLEYKSEATEVAALLAENPDAIGLLPQPFVTVACSQNEALQVVLDMNEQWSLLQGEDGSRMVTGVTVVRREFLEQNEAAVLNFLKEHEESTTAINADVETGALLVVEEGIIAKEAIAQKAIPECNITYIAGEEMKQALSGYLSVLYEQDASAVGGAMPGEDFYYIP